MITQYEGAPRNDECTAQELFAILRLEFQDAFPHLQNEETFHAGEIALFSHARLFLCHVVSIESSLISMQAVIRFPASLPLKVLVEGIKASSSLAISRAILFQSQVIVPSEKIWKSQHFIYTLSQNDIRTRFVNQQ